MGFSHYDIFPNFGSGHFKIEKNSLGRFQIEKKKYEEWTPIILNDKVVDFSAYEEASTVMDIIEEAFLNYMSSNGVQYIADLSENLQALTVSDIQIKNMKIDSVPMSDKLPTTSFESRVKKQELTVDDLIKALEDEENVDESIFPAVVSNGYEQFVSAYQLKIILENLVNKSRG